MPALDGAAAFPALPPAVAPSGGTAAPDLTPFAPPVGRLPLLKLFRTLVENPIETWPRAVYERPIVTLAVPTGKMVFVSDPALVKEVLIDRPDAFPKADLVQRALRPLIGPSSLLTAEGPAWRWQRRNAAPAFRAEVLNGFVPTFTRIAAAHAGRLAGQAGATVDVAEETARITFDAVIATMMPGDHGFDADRIQRALSTYIDTVPMVVLFTVLGLPGWLPYPGRSRARAAVAELRAEVDGLVAACLARPRDTGDLLDLMAKARDPETGRGLDAAELRDTILTLVLAGYETTALALAWTLWLIDRHPAIEAALADEITRVTGGGPVEAHHIEALDLTRRVGMEAMRLFPPVPIITRQSLGATVLGGERLHAGMPVYIPVWAIHRHVSLWPDPGRFDPDRFLPEAVKARPRCAFLPFAAGPRVCIGASFATIEMVAILATLLQRLRFRAPTPALPRPVSRMTLRPEHGIAMRIAPA